MKSSKIDRIISVVVIGTCLIKAVLYGGSKPPSTTNEPPSDISSPTNTVGRGVLDAPQPTTNENAFICGCGVPGGHALPLRTVATLQQTEPSILCSPSPSTFTSVTAWNKRGAFCDWVPITFPDGFAFPCGTNLLTGVTLMAYGEIRATLHSTPTPSIYTLPHPVSLEPDASSFVHGLTPSNSYLFTWQNVCVDRSPTNRVDASIELFRNGDLAITVTPLSSPSPSTFAYQPAVPPAGFVGSGQDTNWLASVFAPTDYTQITNKGYDAWLDDYIGYNEPNGRYKVDVTVAALPDHGPCYLVVGPYKMVVTTTGIYSFPLEVFNEYRAYTCPTRVPLSFSYDDGYHIDEDVSFGMLAAQSNNPNNGPMLLASPGVPDYYIVCMVPNVYVVPSHIPLSQAVGARLSLYCNCSGGTWDYSTYFSNHLQLTFGFPSYAEIRTAEVADRVIVILRVAGHECAGVFFIDSPPPNDDDPPHHECCNACCTDACRCDGTCCLCNCGCHSSSNNNTNTTGTVP